MRRKGIRLKKQTEGAPVEQALPEGPVSVRFVYPAFRHKGVEYISADVEAAAKNGDEQALKVIAELVQRKSGVIEFVDVAEAPADAEVSGDPIEETNSSDNNE